MTVGRPRKTNPSIPGHIDQTKIPVGCYWDKRDKVWYTIHPGPKPRRQKIAGPDALLSELHATMESIRGVDRKTLAWLFGEYHVSIDYLSLSERTQSDYADERDVAGTIVLKDGRKLPDLEYERLNTAFFQRLVGKIAKQGTPSKANHLMRYVRLVYSWAMREGHAKVNPVKGVKQAKERKQRRLPSPEAMAAIIKLAYAAGQKAARSKGACPPYLWAVADLAYLCRLRGIEVVTLTEDHALTEGIQTNRRKGSRDNIVAWTPRLHAAWDALIAYRDRVWAARSMPIPLRARDRPLVIAAHGEAITKSGLDSAWQRIKKRALADKVIAKDEWFGLHDLKRRGVTDTAGSRADKQHSSGHKNESMMDIYDLSLPIVQPSTTDQNTP